MPKTPLTITDKVFDLKFCLVGNSGSGKTHFCGAYNGGPIHFYMCDPGGEKTLFRFKEKIAKGLMTIDRFSLRNNTYTDIWKTIQRDAKDGFFEEMAEKKGLIVLPDSMTTLAMMALTNVAKNHGRDLKDVKNAMRIQDWGVLGQWLKELVAVINDMPCAVAATAHLHTDVVSDGAVLERVPSLPGAIRYSIGLFFDEVYLLETRGDKRTIHFKESNKFQAKSRVFNEKSAKNIDMNDVAEAYLNGTPLKQER